ncbi:Ms4533A family Cys-rich leader peptide [Streptomyces sp. SGAir0957]
MSRSSFTPANAAFRLALIGVTGHSVSDIHCC